MGKDIENEDEIHTFDLIIQETGGFGRFQQIILLLSLISSVVAACNHLSPIYLTYTPCFDCIDNLDLNGSDFQCKGNYQVSVLRSSIYKLGLFGMLKLALALQFIVTNAYFSVACNTKVSVRATLK